MLRDVYPDFRRIVDTYTLLDQFKAKLNEYYE